jgi:hypothetical protein
MRYRGRLLGLFAGGLFSAALLAGCGGGDNPCLALAEAGCQLGMELAKKQGGDVAEVTAKCEEVKKAAAEKTPEEQKKCVEDLTAAKAAAGAAAGGAKPTPAATAPAPGDPRPATEAAPQPARSRE